MVWKQSWCDAEWCMQSEPQVIWYLYRWRRRFRKWKSRNQDTICVACWAIYRFHTIWCPASWALYITSIYDSAQMHLVTEGNKEGGSRMGSNEFSLSRRIGRNGLKKRKREEAFTLIGSHLSGNGTINDPTHRVYANDDNSLFYTWTSLSCRCWKFN